MTGSIGEAAAAVQARQRQQQLGQRGGAGAGADAAAPKPVSAHEMKRELLGLLGPAETIYDAIRRLDKGD